MASLTLSDLPRVANSTRAPCWQQRQIAAQNAYLDGAMGKLKRGATYKAPCDLELVPPPEQGKVKETAVQS